MKFAARACLVLALLGGISCVIPSSRFDQSKRVRLNPRGERMIIRMAGRAKISGEFLFSDETGIWLLLENPNAPFGGEAKTRQVPYGDTEECEVVSLVNRNWGPTVIISQILPALALGAASAIAETDPLASVGLTVGASLPALVTFLLFNSKKPAMPKIIRPTFEKMTEFRKYARYPFVPDTELKKKILKELL